MNMDMMFFLLSPSSAPFEVEGSKKFRFFHCFSTWKILLLLLHHTTRRITLPETNIAPEKKEEISSSNH